MALSNQQKANAILKKFQGRADTSPHLEFYEEPFKSTFIVTPDNFWIDTEHVPDTAPTLEDLEEFKVTFDNGFVLPVLRRYKDLQLNPVPGSPDAFMHEALGDALPHDYKDGSYHYTLKDSQGQELAYGLNNWVVDWQAGIMTFYDGIPEGTTAPYFISFYKYVGRKTFEGVVKTDGTVQMVDEYIPDKLQDVTTKGYVDTEIAKVQDIVDRLMPDKPPELRDLVLKTYLYRAFESGSGTEHDCAIINTPDLIVEAPFFDGDEGILTAYMDGQKVGEKELSTDDDSGTYDSLIIDSDKDMYEGENQRKDFWKELEARIRPSGALSVGQHIARMSHSKTGVTADKFFWIDDPKTPSVRNVQVNLPQMAERYVSGVPTLSSTDFMQVLFLVRDAVGTHYGSKGAEIMSSHIQNQVCDITGVKNVDEVLSYVKDLEIRPNTYTEQLQFNIAGLNSAGESGPQHMETINARLDSVSDETKRVSSGTGEFPTDFGLAYNSQQSLLHNEELQLINATYQWPSGDYSNNLPTPGPNYDILPSDGIRWATFEIGEIRYADGITLHVNGAEGWLSNRETNVTAGVRIFAKIVNTADHSQDTGWLNCNSPYPGVGKPERDGDAAMVVTSSGATIKKVSFGPTTRTGKLYIRIGLPSSNTKFSTITVKTN